MFVENALASYKLTKRKTQTLIHTYIPHWLLIVVVKNTKKCWAQKQYKSNKRDTKTFVCTYESAFVWMYVWLPVKS